jgi:hypothetical protein
LLFYAGNRGSSIYTARGAGRTNLLLPQLNASHIEAIARNYADPVQCVMVLRPPDVCSLLTLA